MEPFQITCFKGKSSEPNLHDVRFQPLIFQGVLGFDTKNAVLTLIICNVARVACMVVKLGSQLGCPAGT